MTLNNDQSPDPKDSANENGQNSQRPRKGQYIITAKDAGWFRPGIFVAPATFVILDPPIPIIRRPPNQQS